MMILKLLNCMSLSRVTVTVRYSLPNLNRSQQHVDCRILRNWMNWVDSRSTSLTCNFILWEPGRPQLFSAARATAPHRCHFPGAWLWSCLRVQGRQLGSHRMMKREFARTWLCCQTCDQIQLDFWDVCLTN